jgi:hypothetical protein
MVLHEPSAASLRADVADIGCLVDSCHPPLFPLFHSNFLIQMVTLRIILFPPLPSPSNSSGMGDNKNRDSSDDDGKLATEGS